MIRNPAFEEIMSDQVQCGTGDNAGQTGEVNDLINLKMLVNEFYILFYFLLAVQAQDCTNVVDLWTSLGKTTTVSRTSQKGCCSMYGVSCNGANVIGINWASQSLTGPIPDYIGNLIKVKTL
jgi:hypothetical protein